MSSQQVHHQRLRAQGQAHPHSFVSANEISASVMYAKISSDYLSGQAASVQDLAKKDPKQTSFKDQRYRPPSELPPAHAFSTLDHARRVLLKDFRQFETDCTSWAGYLTSASDLLERNRHPGAEEAEEIMDAVHKAMIEVQKVCGVPLFNTEV